MDRRIITWWDMIKTEAGDIWRLGRHRLMCGDMTHPLAIGDLLDGANIEAIMTDPPYPGQFLPLYGHLARCARKILPPGGSCLAMAGQYHLDKIIPMMSKHLDYYWLIDCQCRGANGRVWNRRIWQTWKPILWYVKDKRTIKKWTGDSVISEYTRKKDSIYHKWAQSVPAFEAMLQIAAPDGGIVLDPFAGGGTAIIAGEQSGHTVFGME